MAGEKVSGFHAKSPRMSRKGARRKFEMLCIDPRLSAAFASSREIKKLPRLSQGSGWIFIQILSGFKRVSGKNGHVRLVADSGKRKTP
ncbi:MAG TPA: hypothetical protein VLJ68_10210, partial [Chitinophagaceae bacterium]|nr:hypothetical protein [Chitinophagaceae bacterium]